TTNETQSPRTTTPNANPSRSMSTNEPTTDDTKLFGDARLSDIDSVSSPDIGTLTPTTAPTAASIANNVYTNNRDATSDGAVTNPTSVSTSTISSTIRKRSASESDQTLGRYTGVQQGLGYLLLMGL